MTDHLTDLTTRLGQAQEIIEDQLLPLLRLTADQADTITQQVTEATGSARIADQTLARAYALLAPAAREALVVSRFVEEAAAESRRVRRRVSDLTPVKA